MLGHRDNHLYEQWNLESTAQLLSERFPNHRVLVVKPKVMHLKTFSRYCNFVKSGDTGVPEHSAGQSSWRHLTTLIQAVDRALPSEWCTTTAETASLSSEQCTMTAETPSQPSERCTMTQSLTLIGFSKGCVVLNQLLYDLPQAREDPHSQALLPSLSALYWLDGGHNGGSNTWVTDQTVLGNLAGTGARLYVHVTPYQTKDPLRVWIGREHKLFVARLTTLGADIHSQLHFAEEDRSLQNHFNILRKF